MISKRENLAQHSDMHGSTSLTCVVQLPNIGRPVNVGVPQTCCDSPRHVVKVTLVEVGIVWTKRKQVKPSSSCVAASKNRRNIATQLSKCKNAFLRCVGISSEEYTPLKMYIIFKPPPQSYIVRGR